MQVVENVKLNLWKEKVFVLKSVCLMKNWIRWMNVSVDNTIARLTESAHEPAMSKTVISALMVKQNGANPAPPDSISKPMVNAMLVVTNVWNVKTPRTVFNVTLNLSTEPSLEWAPALTKLVTPSDKTNRQPQKGIRFVLARKEWEKSEIKFV